MSSHTLAPTTICDLSHSICRSPLTDLGHISSVTYDCHPLWFVGGHRKGILTSPLRKHSIRDICTAMIHYHMIYIILLWECSIGFFGDGKISVCLFVCRIRKGLPYEARVITQALPTFLADFFPPQDIMNKVIGEFLSSQQPHPQLMATVVFQVKTLFVLFRGVMTPLSPSYIIPGVVPVRLYLFLSLWTETSKSKKVRIYCFMSRDFSHGMIVPN